MVEINVPSLAALPPRPKTAAPDGNDINKLRSMVKELSEKHARRAQDISSLRSNYSRQMKEYNVGPNVLHTFL